MALPPLPRGGIGGESDRKAYLVKARTLSQSVNQSVGRGRSVGRSVSRPVSHYRPGLTVLRRTCSLNACFVITQDRSPEFAAARQQALHAWLTQITQRPQLWCDDLVRVPLSLTLTLSLTLARCDDLQEFLSLAPPRGDGLPSSEGAGGGVGGGAGGAGRERGTSAVEPPPPAAELAELEWIAARMGGVQGGVQRQASGAARGDSIVRWLLAQALAGSREQAVTLAEALRRQGLLVPAGKVSKFVDSSSASYQLYSQSGSMARHTAPA